MSTAYYPDALERHAESAWRRLNLSPPVELEAVTSHLQVTLRKRMLDPDLCGLYIITRNHRLIVINKGLPLTRQRFTIAHEIGHHLMSPKDAAPGVICRLTLSLVKPRPIDERRADRFAAALLMPHWIVRKWHGELAGNPTGRVPVMADRFGVSLTAMRLRLKELRLTIR